jgi:hypothetical protein
VYETLSLRIGGKIVGSNFTSSFASGRGSQRTRVGEVYQIHSGAKIS